MAFFQITTVEDFCSIDHSESVEDFCTLDNAGTELDLLIHESLLILRDRPTLNQRNSSIPLCRFKPPVPF